MSSQTPPPHAERLLTAALGAGDWTDGILGDLHEEYAARAHRSRAGARAWYWRQALRLSGHGLARRVRRARMFQERPPMAEPLKGDSLMRTLGLETRHALRAIAKRPGMSAIVVLTLSLGLGANAAVFEMIDALVLRPFTMRDVDRMTMMSYGRPDDLDRRESVSPADFLDWKKQTDVFDHLVAFDWWTANLVGRDEPENVQGFFVSSDFFSALGVTPAMGRDFLPDEETLGKHRRVILNHDLWQRRFASDASIVGRSIDIDGNQYEVIGIAPAGFDFPMGCQVWAPLAFKPTDAAERRAAYLTVIGRLAPGRQFDDAVSQMTVIGQRLEKEHPDTNRGRVARVYTIGEGMMDVGLKPILSMWQASALFVLLIACANVANLLLARGAERQREMAVRLAMGASRARVVREMLIESVILAGAAVPAALAVTWVSLELIRAYMPAKIARFVAGWYQMDVDGRLVVFTAALALLTAIVFGLFPAFQASRPKLAETLKEGGRSATSGGSRLRLRRGLVVAEMALALPLLVASALSVVTVNRFLNGPQGYDPDNLLTMQVVLASGRYPDVELQRQFAVNAVERLRSIPGVVSAAAINIMPGADSNSSRSIEIDGRPNVDPANAPQADFRRTTPDIFAALKQPLISGRAFTDADREDTQPVAIVTQSFARKFFGDADPLGKRVKLGVGADARWATVVGVCGDVIHNWFARRNYPTIYRPFSQDPYGSMALVVRTAGEPSVLAGSARAAIRALDPAQPLFEIKSMRASLKERTIGLQYVGGVMFAFGGIALVLALVGVYGVMAYMVTQRRHEIGVRIALGATRRDVMRLTVGQTGKLTAVGVGLGLVLSVALKRLIEAGLFGITTTDARMVLGLAALLVVSALAAGYFPARRAAAIEPMIAFRSE